MMKLQAVQNKTNIFQLNSFLYTNYQHVTSTMTSRDFYTNKYINIDVFNLFKSNETDIESSTRFFYFELEMLRWKIFSIEKREMNVISDTSH